MQSRPPLRLLWLGLVSALVLLTTTAPAQKRDFRDEKYGYAVRTVPKWVGVPVQPTEKFSVAKWASPRDERRYPGRMFVYMFDRTEKKEDPRVQKLERLIRHPSMNVRSFQDWAKLYRRGLVLDNPTDIKLKDLSGSPITARLYETTYGEQNKSRSGPPTGYFTVIAVITLPEREYAVELYCGSAVKKKYRSTFLKVARSFELLESPGRTNTNSGASAANSPREEARRRARQDAARVPGWWFVESENYFIVTNTPPKKKARILNLKRDLEAMREVYKHDFPPVKPIEAISIVRVCKDHQSYRHYGGPPGSGGYWYSAAQELVLFHQGNKDFARSVLFHEAFHQYIHYACGEIHLHIWFNEGHADYYGGSEIFGKRAVIRMNRMRVDTIRAAMRNSKYVPLPQFLKFTQRQYYRRASLCYAQGWSFVYFLNKGVDPEHPWSRILPTYFKTLIAEGDQNKALDTAFQGVDLTALDEAWKKFIIDKRVVRP
jgi:hypothetical protein